MHDGSSRVNEPSTYERWNWDDVTLSDLNCRLTTDSGLYSWRRLSDLSWHDVASSRPAREFHAHQERRNYSGLHYSATTRRHVPVESRHERMFVTVADADPNLVEICAQPFMLKGTSHDSVVTRFPDFLLAFSTGRVEVVDVTTPQRRLEPRTAASFDWTDRAMALRGWSYRVWDGDDPQYLQNLAYVSAHRFRERTDDAALEKLQTCLCDEPKGVSIRDLIGDINEERRAFALPALMYLVWCDFARINLREPLSMATLVYPSGPETGGDQR